MRRSLVWVFVLSLTSACPTAHRPEGYLDRDSRADIKRQTQTERCDQEKYRKLCLDPLDEEELEECLKACFE
ncbi:hypothetical protein [Myxococcus sp. RHSTA-1-4]|uniref:hypothetical protein n=1 Tax=Myxococcus sp. RHSTA-1-4 TaxID=2874601 RepID=UPI001CBC61E6|nr:hypothetical protein [Myxococcus sp. RHSTA-1-4]MBZ4415228.1 hypothetical protein [Myxococcus sp. RHSTA-1-4]